MAVERNFHEGDGMTLFKRYCVSMLCLLIKCTLLRRRFDFEFLQRFRATSKSLKIIEFFEHFSFGISLNVV